MMNDNNRNKQVVAVKYDNHNSDAPTVIAKGTGIIADKILETANDCKIPVVQNKVLTGLLMAVKLDNQIPPELYQAMAEVLAYVYRLDQKAKK